MPGRCRMCAASFSTRTLSTVYSPLSGITTAVSFIAALPHVPTPPFRSAANRSSTGAKAQVAHRHAGQLFAQPLQERPFAKVGQLLHQDRPDHFDLQHSTLQSADAGIRRGFGSDRLSPSSFEPQPILLAAPTTSDKQPAQHFADRL